MSEPGASLLNRMRAALAVRSKRTPPIRWHTEREFLGLPLVDIAVGMVDGAHGRARGIVAIGDRATGVIAFGVIARGVLALGVVAIGAVSVGSVAIGALAVGGLAGGLVAFGAAAVGVHALGGVAIAIVAVGVLAIGNYAAGVVALGDHVYTRTVQDPEVLDAIASIWAWWPFGR